MLDIRSMLRKKQENEQVPNESLMQRIGRNVVAPSGDNAYKAGMLLFGKTPTANEDSYLDNAIKLNQLQTGTPEFKMQEAQTRANIDIQKALDIEKAKKAQAQADYDAAMASQGGGEPQSNGLAPMPISGPSMPTSMPQKGGNIPQFLTIPGQPTYDPSIGRMVPGKPTIEKNPDYLTPDEMKANQEKEQMIRDSATQSIQAIEEAKKGAKFFGPFGDFESRYVASSLPVVGGLTMGEPKLKGEYGERATWEANVNKILSQKVVDLIMRMKDASKTGATGFGQLSDREGAILQQASTALNKKLPGDVAIQYLDEMDMIYKKILNGGQQPGGYDTDKEARYQAWKASQNATA